MYYNNVNTSMDMFCPSNQPTNLTENNILSIKKSSLCINPGQASFSSPLPAYWFMHCL